MITPGVQKPHCVPSFSWNARCNRLMRPSVARLSIVSIVPTLATRSQRDARDARLAVDQHGAGPALATVAALFGAGQADAVAQVVDQQHVVGDRVFAFAAVDGQFEQTFAGHFSCSSPVAGSAHRGRRHPAGAHGGAVGALRRLRCGARPGVAPHNSLRSLRSLRSDRCGESVHEARCARRPQACAPRRPTNRPCRVPPAAKATWCWFSNATPPAGFAAKARPGRRQRACGAPRSTGLVARARSAPRELTCRTLSERSERSERSELCDGPQGRAPQGSRCAAPTAPPKRCRLPGRDFAAAGNARSNVNTSERSEARHVVHCSRLLRPQVPHPHRLALRARDRAGGLDADIGA